MHIECPDTFSEILRSMPTEQDIDTRKNYSQCNSFNTGPAEFDRGLSWNYFHNSDSYLDWN